MNEIKEALEKDGRYWIAFVGDSITSTEWVHPNWREIVEYVLKDKFKYDWGIKTFNFAYDGSTTNDLVNRIDEVEVIKPEMVILLTGANDPFAGVSCDNFVKNLKVIKEKVGTKLVLATDTCPVDDWAASKCEPYVAAMKNFDEKCIDLFIASKSFPLERIYTFISEMDIPEERVKKGEIDFWHPNQLGNAYIAKVILEKVWGIGFDPERYMTEVNKGEKLPKY